MGKGDSESAVQYAGQPPVSQFKPLGQSTAITECGRRVRNLLSLDQESPPTRLQLGSTCREGIDDDGAFLSQLCNCLKSGSLAAWQVAMLSAISQRSAVRIVCGSVRLPQVGPDGNASREDNGRDEAIATIVAGAMRRRQGDKVTGEGDCWSVSLSRCVTRLSVE